MSVQVANISLASAVIGTTGTIPLSQVTPPPTIAQQMRPQAERGPNLFVWNESGCGLTCLFPLTRATFTIPAGGWRQVAVPPGEESLSYVVTYVIPNAPVSSLLADLYQIGEELDTIGVLGNSPMQGTVTMANNPIILSTPVKVTGRTSTAQLVSVVGLAPADRDTLIYIVSYLDVENGVSGNALTWGVQYTCATDGLVHTETLMVVQQSTNTVVALDGAAVRANGRYNGVSQGIWVKAGTPINVVFRDPTNTPNDSFAASAIVADL